MPVFAAKDGRSERAYVVFGAFEERSQDIFSH